MKAKKNKIDSKIGVCRLCKNEKKLIKSHLFPDFMYKGIGDELNRMNIISSVSPCVNKFAQSGAYDKNILCGNCDNEIIGLHERFINNNFYSLNYFANDNNFEQIISDNEIEFLKIKKIEYNHFKIFVDSILWRASISSHELFQNFKLSEEQEEQLRNSIYNNIPLNVHDYPCVIRTCKHCDESLTDLVYVDFDKNNYITFFVNQFTYTYFLGNIDALLESYNISEMDDFIINKRNELKIIKLPSCNWNEMRSGIFNKVAKIANNNF